MLIGFLSLRRRVGPKKLCSMVLFLVWWNGKSANALAPAFAIPLFRFRVSCSFGATSKDVLGMGLPEA